MACLIGTSNVYRGIQMMSAFEEAPGRGWSTTNRCSGRDRGRLAVSLDRFTNALVLVGSTPSTAPASAIPRFRRWTSHHQPGTVHAKELVQSLMEELALG